MTSANANDSRDPADLPVVWLAAGGTGGHIYPAIEIGGALLRAAPGMSPVYFCGNRPSELAIYRAHGIDPVVLPLSGRRPGIRGFWRFCLEMLRALIRARAESRAAPPGVAVGFGGYPSAPALWAARSAGAAIFIQEQNALPGRANRLLSRFAHRIFAGLPFQEGALPPHKTSVTGNPIRADLLVAMDTAEARRAFGLPESGPTVLCFGGSLGARGLNGLILKALATPASRAWHWIWATGPDHFDAIRRETASREGLILRPYLDEMRAAYAAADLVVCRAGALTLAELAALGKPSILVPLPTAAKDHQRINAQGFESAGAAVVIDETDPAAEQKFVTWLEQFAADCDKLGQLGTAARGLGRPEAAHEIVSEILRFLEARNATPAPQRTPARPERP
jgi:UDP-N-acetylglucosamine--N-acetylmuramyl-(pentapeptide) pyrophosphoryl-undecaprenol N-acetylglucosamine transferase